jgi:hypothetical protein
MTIERQTVCAECGAERIQDDTVACALCGAHAVVIHLQASDEMSIAVRDTIGLKVGPKKKSGPGSKARWQREVKQTHESWMGTERIVERTLDADRTVNSISEKCVDVQTGETMLDKSELLSEHNGHGSAKRGQLPGAQEEQDDS